MKKILLLGPTNSGKSTLMKNFIYTLSGGLDFQNNIMEKIIIERRAFEGATWHKIKTPEIYDPFVNEPGTQRPASYDLRLIVSHKAIEYTLELRITDERGQTQRDAITGDNALEAYKMIDKFSNYDGVIFLTAPTCSEDELSAFIGFAIDKNKGSHEQLLVCCYNNTLPSHRQNVEHALIDKQEMMNHLHISNLFDLPRTRKSIFSISNFRTEAKYLFQCQALLPFFWLIDQTYDTGINWVELVERYIKHRGYQNPQEED